MSFLEVVTASTVALFYWTGRPDDLRWRKLVSKNIPGAVL